VLELTGSYSITSADRRGAARLLSACGSGSAIPFSTWRLHQRGLKLQGAHDVGWIQELTAETLMQRDMVFVRTSDSLEATKAAHPAGGTGQLFVLDDNGGYWGVIDVPVLRARTGAHRSGGRRLFARPRAAASGDAGPRR